MQVQSFFLTKNMLQITLMPQRNSKNDQNLFPLIHIINELSNATATYAASSPNQTHLRSLRPHHANRTGLFLWDSVPTTDSHSAPGRVHSPCAWVNGVRWVRIDNNTCDEKMNNNTHLYTHPQKEHIKIIRIKRIQIAKLKRKYYPT